MITALLSWPLLPLAQREPYWDHHDGDGWWMALGMGGFWLILILAVILLVRGGHVGSRAHPAPERPLEILKRRLAHGEITPAEYEQRRRLLVDGTDADADASGDPT